MTSKYFIHGTEALFNFLSQIFGAMLIHGCCNRLFNKSIIKTIPQNKQKSCCDSTNYRAKSLNYIVSKLLDYVLISLMGDKMSTNQMQFTYKSGFSTSLFTFLVLETIQYYRVRGSGVFALLLDVSKAFDKWSIITFLTCFLVEKFVLL